MLGAGARRLSAVNLRARRTGPVRDVVCMDGIQTRCGFAQRAEGRGRSGITTAVSAAISVPRIGRRTAPLPSRIDIVWRDGAWRQPPIIEVTCRRSRRQSPGSWRRFSPFKKPWVGPWGTAGPGVSPQSRFFRIGAGCGFFDSSTEKRPRSGESRLAGKRKGTDLRRMTGMHNREGAMKEKRSGKRRRKKESYPAPRAPAAIDRLPGR